MRAKILLVAVLCSAPAWAVDCPVFIGKDDLAIETIDRAIKSARNCEQAAVIAEACSSGGEHDVDFAMAERKCGLDFWKKLSAAEKKAYDRKQERCNDKYWGMEGSGYPSLTALCRLGVARQYSARYRRMEH